jgi:hypothetical protein
MTPQKERLQGKPDCEQGQQLPILQVMLFLHPREKHAV